MNTQEIGYISKTHGLKGQVTLRLKEDIFIDEEKITSIFLDINGSQVPYFVEEIKSTNTGYLVKFENIDSVDTSKKLIGKTAYCLEDFITEDEETLKYFIGYTVTESKHANIGNIVDIDDKTEKVAMTSPYPS